MPHASSDPIHSPAHAAVTFAAALLLALASCRSVPPNDPGAYGPSGDPDVSGDVPLCLGIVSSFAEDDDDGYSGLPDEETLRWSMGGDHVERGELSAWCRGVGGAASYWPTRQPRLPIADRLTIVVWNIQAGGGDLDRLLEDIREGALDEGVGHFALLLQEAYRAGGDVPVEAPSGSRSASRVAVDPPRGERLPVDRVARRHGLFLYYVPSMRNGREGEPPEDRGNAILSTLPLTDLQAIELPLERQRRVAQAATVRAMTAGGVPWELQLVNIHLDPRSRWQAFHRSLGAGRARQAEFLAHRFSDGSAVALGGDLNTWLDPSVEGAIESLRERFPLPAEPPEDGTVAVPILPDPQLDHLFFRLPSGWAADYRVIPDSYGSDHRPLVGWVRVGLAQ